jgi:hypothetical protein
MQLIIIPRTSLQNDSIRASTSLIVGDIEEGMSGHKATLL